MKIQLLCVVVLACSAPLCTAAPMIHAAWYQPDKHWPDHKWREGWREPEQLPSDDSLMAGALHLLVHNPTDQTLKLDRVSIDGRPVQDLRDRDVVIWWRFVPCPLPAGRVSELTIRLRRAPKAQTPLELRFANGTKITTTVSSSPPALAISSLAFNDELDELWVYVQRRCDRKGGQLHKVFVDGNDVTDRPLFHSPHFFHNVALAKVKLSSPRTYGHQCSVKVLANRRRFGCGFPARLGQPIHHRRHVRLFKRHPDRHT